MSRSDVRAEWEAAVLASDLRAELKVTAWGIRSFADRHGRCFPSAATLARVCNITRRTLFRHLDALEAAGWIARHRGKGQHGNGGATTLIALLEPEGGDSHADTTSPARGSDTQGDTTLTPKVVTGSPKVVTDSAQGSDTQGVTRTIEPVKKNHSMRGSRRAPADFVIDRSMRAWLAENGIAPSLAERELPKFKDFEFARPYRDWPACFRNWMRRAAEQSNVSVSQVDQVEVAAAELGIKREAGESDERFGKRVRDALVARQYGYSMEGRR